MEKLAEYAEFGIAMYWILDPGARLVEVLRLAGDGCYEIALAVTGGVPSVPGCDGLALDLDALWAEVDRLLAADGGESE